VCELIADHIARFPARDGLVFSATEGGPVRHRNFYRRHFEPARAASVIPAAARFHDLRHTCAAFLIDEKRHIEEVKDYLGHSSIRVTSDRYGHLFPQRKAELADALDARFVRSQKQVVDRIA
jgi:integrase